MHFPRFVARLAPTMVIAISPCLAPHQLAAQGMGNMNMGQTALPVSPDDLLKLAKADFAISSIRDSIQGALAKPARRMPQSWLRKAHSHNSIDSFVR